MEINFIEDEKIDFQPENIEQPILQGKVQENVEYSPYDQIINDASLSKEQKIAEINKLTEAKNKEIDKQHKIKMAKLLGGGALQIASAAIPFGGPAKAGGQLALKIAKPAFREISKKVVAKNIGSAMASAIPSGSMYEAGQALIENKNIEQIAKDSIKGGVEGMVTGGITGTIAGKIANKFGKTAKTINIVENKNSIPQMETIKGNIRDLIRKRRLNIDLANYEATQKINSFISQVDEFAKELNLNPKNLREIMPFIRENTDLPEKNFNRLDLINTYKNLSNEQKDILKTIADNHSKDMEVYWNRLSELKNSKSTVLPDEYITHIWDKTKISADDKRLLERYLNNKLDIQTESTKNGFSKLSSDFKKPELTLDDFYELFNNNSQFEQRRIIPTYKKGIEGIQLGEKNIKLNPKTLDYALIQKIHANKIIEAAENTSFLNELQKIEVNGKSITDLKEFKDVINSVFSAKTEPKKATNLASKLVEKATNAYDIVNNFAKGCKFLFNGMHAIALTESSAAHSDTILPIKTIKTLGNIPKIIDGIKNNNYELFKNSDLAKKAIKDGVQFGAISDIDVAKFDTFLDSFSKILDKTTLGISKIVTKPLRSMVDLNNKFLWNYLHNTYKLHTYDTLIKRVSQNGKIELSDATRQDIAQLVNDTFGGQNWDTLGIKPKTLKTAKRLFLSPDWNISATIRQSLAIFSSKTGQKFLNKFAESSKIGAATRELSRKLGLSSFVNDIQGAEVRGKQARRYFMMFLLQTAIYSNTINACCRVVDYFKDKEKYQDGISNLTSYNNNRFSEKDSTGKKIVYTLFPRPYVGQNEYGRETYARVGKQALEIPEIVEDMPNSAVRKIASKTAPLINPLATKFSDELTDNWNKASIKDRYKETFTPFTLSKKDKFHPIDAFYSTTKGVNSYQARAYLKECIKNNDIEAIEKFKPKMKANKIDFDKTIKRVYKELEEEDYGIRRN